MIDVRELSIGDWVKGCDGFTYEVCKIRPNIATLKSENGRKLDFDDIQVEPIPLTDEILVRNGFVVEPCGCVWYQEQGIQEQNYLIVSFRRNGEPRSVEMCFVNKIVAKMRGIYYVHQLQHLLRLCGIEKTIEL